MTRLKTSDISHINRSLASYDQALIGQTGRSMFGIACHAAGTDEQAARAKTDGFTVRVIPVTSGLGVISRFSETVCAILAFLGFDASVSKQTDVAGLALAFEEGAAAVMMADDRRFVGINLKNRTVADNTVLTGRVFVSALSLMAGGLENKPVLVMGCGPVGESSARRLLDLGARPCLYDIRPDTARALHRVLAPLPGGDTVRVETELSRALSAIPFIVEATPAADTIPDHRLTDQVRIAAPGVPSGVSHTGARMIGARLIHDKLELGTAAMAVSLL